MIPRSPARARALLLPLLLLATGVAPPRAHAEGAPVLLGRVAVGHDGFWRLRADPLRAALEASGAAAVRVTRGGRPVPAQPVAGTGDLVFLALDVAGPASATAVFEVWGAGPDAGVAADGPDLVETGTLPGLVARDADRLFGALAGAREAVYAGADPAPPFAWAAPALPTWFLARILPGQGWLLDLDPHPFPPGADLVLEVDAWGTQVGRLALAADWGGADLGTAEVATAAGGATMRWRVPADRVPAQGAALRLRDVSPAPPPPAPQDVSDGRGTIWVDAVRLEGPAPLVADARLRRWRLDVAGPVRLDFEAPPTGGWVALVGADGTAPQMAALGPPDGTGRRRAHVAGPGPGARLVASTTVEDAELVRASLPPDPVAATADAEHLVLSTPLLLPEARRLAAHRTQGGLPSVAIDVTDVYATSGHGEASPRAIRDFLVRRMEAKGRALRYVLLCGDATLDRTDLAPFPTIPAPMARTMYNGATAADRLYALPPDGAPVGGPAIGRLPFRDAATLRAYVDRVIRYETRPPADATRRLLRFVTSEARFNPFLDRILEGQFRTVLSRDVPPAYDVEVTFASATSPFLWPPADLNEKVVRGFDEGCLFYTYVGHGFAEGFDSLRLGRRAFPIFLVRDAARVACEGTPPITFVIACTTAIFDRPDGEGVGEALLARPEGPVAYWGATRICHPAANTLLGRAIARRMAGGRSGLRLGDLLARATDQVVRPTEPDPDRALIDMGITALAWGADPGRLALEGSWTYALLGDPGLRIALPADDVTVAATSGDGRLQARFATQLPDGTALQVSLELPRNRDPAARQEGLDPLDPAAAGAIRAQHARMNDRALLRGTVRLEGGRGTWSVELPPDTDPSGLVVKAWCVAEGDVHQGAAILP